MNLPAFENYGKYKSDNYGRHCLKFYMPGITIWFSYQKPVAFRTFGDNGKMVVRQNDWGQTTDKHLNWIDGGDKANRVDGHEFERLLQEAVGNR